MSGDEATLQIDALLDGLGDWRAETLRHVRSLIHAAVPDVVETWKWMGSPVWESGGILAVGNAHKDQGQADLPARRTDSRIPTVSSTMVSVARPGAPSTCARATPSTTRPSKHSCGERPSTTAAETVPATYGHGAMTSGAPDRLRVGRLLRASSSP